MKKGFVFFSIILFLGIKANVGFAQVQTITKSIDSFTYNVVKGDTIYDFYITTLDITAQKKFSNDTLRYRYNQLKLNIKTVFPYVKEAGRLFNEIKAKSPTLSRRERKKYLAEKEEELRIKFEEPLKNLYDTQGKLLVLLISRETGVSVYKMLKEIKNTAKAAVYEASALTNGINLNEEWDASKYKTEDLIMKHFENAYGYPTPNNKSKY